MNAPSRRQFLVSCAAVAILPAHGFPALGPVDPVKRKRPVPDYYPGCEYLGTLSELQTKFSAKDSNG